MVRTLNVEPRLIEIKNGINIQYFCFICNTMLVEIENNTVKRFQSCEHFHTERISKGFFSSPTIKNSKFKAKFIEKDKNYYYLIVPNVKD